LLAFPRESTSNAAAYFADPGAAYFRGRRFLCASPGANVFTLFAWGRLGPDDARELLAVLDAAEQAPGPPRRQLVDLRQVEEVATAALVTLMSFYQRMPRYVQTVACEAVVRPDGVVGILAEGFYPAVPLPFRRAVFRAIDDALAWVGLEPARVGDWTRKAVDAVLSQSAYLREGLDDLVATLVDLGANASLADLARAHATTPRTLQRRFARAETSFRKERARALAAAAIERMAAGNVEIKRVARDLGFASESRFSEQFRREIGESPQRYRRRLEVKGLG
jgi:AraC-like DNA-binding protein